MPLTDAGLCNMALARIGQRDFISDLDEDTVAAQVCSVHYDVARDAVLESFPWPFATRRSVLAALSGVERTNWDYVYSLPTDCVAPRAIVVDGSRAPTSNSKIPFAIELNNTATAKVLLTDLEDAELIYTARLETVGLYPALFSDALAWRLAIELALAMPVKPQVGLAMQRGFEVSMARAAAAQMRAATEDVAPDSEFIRER